MVTNISGSSSQRRPVKADNDTELKPKKPRRGRPSASKSVERVTKHKKAPSPSVSDAADEVAFATKAALEGEPEGSVVQSIEPEDDTVEDDNDANANDVTGEDDLEQDQQDGSGCESEIT